METVTIAEAQARLPDLIQSLTAGEVVVITENDEPVAKLISERPSVHQRPRPGLGKGVITIVADDEEHLQDFSGYMP